MQGMPMQGERVIQAEPIRLPVETIRVPTEAPRVVPLAGLSWKLDVESATYSNRFLQKGVWTGHPAICCEFLSAEDQFAN